MKMDWSYNLRKSLATSLLQEFPAHLVKCKRHQSCHKYPLRMPSSSSQLKERLAVFIPLKMRPRKVVHRVGKKASIVKDSTSKGISDILGEVEDDNGIQNNWHDSANKGPSFVPTDEDTTQYYVPVKRRKVISLISSDDSSDSFMGQSHLLHQKRRDANLAREIVRNHNYLAAKIGGYNILDNDLNNVLRSEVTDNVIDAYIHFLCKQHSESTSYHIPTAAMQKIMGGKDVFKKNGPQCGWDNTHNIIAPYLENGNHWVLLVIQPKNQRVVYYNSQGPNEEMKKEYCDKIRAFMRNKIKIGKSWRVDCPTVSRQPDSISCSIFVCKFAEAQLKTTNLVFGSNPQSLLATKEDVYSMRIELVQTIMTNSEKIGNLCSVCTMQIRKDNKIKCTDCSRCFHTTCAQLSETIFRVFIHHQYRLNQ